MENQETNIASKEKLGAVEVKNTVTINSTDMKITKVLTASAKVKLENIITLNAQAKLEGKIEYNLLVVLENNEIAPITQHSNFSTVFENSLITPESTIYATSNILECNNSSGSMDIVYSCLVNFDVYMISVNNDLICAKAEENIFVKESEVSYNYLVGSTTYDANINFEIVKDDKVNKILFLTSSESVKSVIPSDNYFVVSGEVCSTIVYLGTDGVIRSLIKQTPFSEEIEFSGVTKNSNIQVLTQNQEAVIVENSDKNAFTFDIPVRIFARIFDKKTQNCIVDAYSLTNEINLTMQSFKESEFFSTRQAEENILTNFTLTESMQPIDKILATVPTNISLANQIVKDGEIILEGVATINIIYYFEDDESNNILNSLDVEVPYSMSINVPEIKEGQNLSTTLSLSDINVKNKRGKELEILAKVLINYDYVKESMSAITTSLTVGEEKPQKDYALEFYLAKEGQTLWDIAKELNLSSAELVKQNQELSLPIKSGEKIVAYNGTPSHD